MFIIVQVNEGAKIIIGPLVKEVEESSLFSTLFDSVFSGNYFHQNVRVEVRRTETGPWVSVQEGLQANSIELSLAEPWASKDSWQEVVLNVFELTSMMKKYFDHLDNTNNNMKALHESENPAREPSTNCNISSW
ncbi:unnamed protein product [Rhizophagus irregularis]|nr:unnamed protein product [Rhizophagus irregularis]